jgi:hypothetical protein
MKITSIFRSDRTNVGDWFCSPDRYFPELKGNRQDIIEIETAPTLDGHIILGGGGLIAATFDASMTFLAAQRPRLSSLVAWGIGESLIVDRKGGFVSPYNGALPTYLQAFDLIGLRDFGTDFRWTPCVSCMLPQFDQPAAPTQDIVFYEHKRIPIPIDGHPRLTNAEEDIDSVLNFLASAETVITNSYHGAYWATLLGRRVLAIPNMSKMYRFKHAPVLCEAVEWRRYLGQAIAYPDALAECRQATINFKADVDALIKGS